MNFGPTEIEAMLAVSKSLAGEPGWIADERGTVCKLAAPVIGAGVIGALTIHAHATRFTGPQRGGIALVCDSRPIQRLSFKPDHSHRNPFTHSTPAELRGRLLTRDVSRVHAWSDNRSWPRPAHDNVDVARSLGVEPGEFAEAVAVFLHLCGIVGVLPPPPWEPELL